jgi:hypothetical protein
MAKPISPSVRGRLIVLWFAAGICVVSLAGCSKRCKPGLTLSDGKCVGSAEGSQLSDGGIADASKQEEVAARDADVDSGDEASSARSGSAGRDMSDARDAGVSGAAGSGGASSAAAAAGMMSSSPAVPASVCGDGIVQGKEICDPASASAPCPTSCEDDANPCTKTELTGDSAACTAECKQSTVTALVAGDECCPSGATPATDADCAAACTSTSEVCDGRDNDCDGEADEGVRNACGGCAALTEEPRAACSDGSGACEVAGVFECDGMDAVSCNATARPSEPEDCDDADNDCDGRIDEGVLNGCGGCARLEHERGDSCTAGSGACAGRGVYVCMGTDAVVCDARARTPAAESCDGEDNDCDGSVDEEAGKTWYQDCDGDGYAPQGTGREACSEPAAMNGCDWIERAPSASATDCDDMNEARHPGADFGLPISRTGQTLPPPNDSAYDLDCDGQLMRSNGAFATGKIVQGQLETLDLCPDGFSCTGGGPYCVLPFPIVGGGAVCGQPYSADAPCTGQINVYIQCR